MKCMTTFWAATDDDLRFRGAVGGVLMVLNEREDTDTVAKITAELDSLKNLSALMSGVPVDMDRVTIPDNPVGLMKMWEEAKKNEAPM